MYFEYDDHEYDARGGEDLATHQVYETASGKCPYRIRKEIGRDSQLENEFVMLGLSLVVVVSICLDDFERIKNEVHKGSN